MKVTHTRCAVVVVVVMRLAGLAIDEVTAPPFDVPLRGFVPLPGAKRLVLDLRTRCHPIY